MEHVYTEDVGTGQSGEGRDRERASSRAVFGAMTVEERGGRTFSSFFRPALMRGPATTGPPPPPRSLLKMFFMACILFFVSRHAAPPFHRAGVRSLSATCSSGLSRDTTLRRVGVRTRTSPSRPVALSFSLPLSLQRQGRVRWGSGSAARKNGDFLTLSCYK